MKSIIIRSAVILGLGIAPGAVLAQSDSTQQPGAQSGTGSVSGQSGAEQPQSGTMPKDAEGGMSAGSGSGAGTGTDTQTEGGSSGANGTQTQPGAAGSGQQQGTGSAAGQQSGEGMDQGSTQQGQSTDKTAKPNGGVSGETTGSIDVTTEQRTEIRQIITEEKVEPLANADIDITVGTAVPQTVEVHTLPPRIVELVPAYEGYKYFVLADGRIVIVDPNSMEIVYVITA